MAAALLLALFFLMAEGGDAQVVRETPERWSLSGTPLLSMGDGPGEAGGPGHDFFRIASVEGDGERIVVADGSSREIRVFDREGRLLRRLGGPGEGPGRFGELSWATLLTGGEIAAWDRGLRRLTLFDGGGEVRSTTSLEPADGAAFPSPVTTLGDGSLLVDASPPGDPATRPREIPTGRNRFEGVLAVWEADGTFREVLTDNVLGTETYRGLHQGRLVQMPAPFPFRTFLRSGPGSVVVAENLGPRLRRLELETGAWQELRWAEDARPVTAAQVEERAEAILSELGEDAGPMGPVVRRMLGEAPPPPHHPWYDEVRVARDEAIWIRRAPLPGDGMALWRVLAPSGALLARLELPRAFVPWVIREETVTGVWTDDLDVESVRVHFLRRGDGGAPDTRESDVPTETSAPEGDDHSLPIGPIGAEQ